MLPIKLIKDIEDTISTPDQRVLIMCKSVSLRSRIRQEDMARIAFPERKKTDNKECIVLANHSMIRFHTTSENVLRGFRYDLAILVDLTERERERLLPVLMPCMALRDGRIEHFESP